MRRSPGVFLIATIALALPCLARAAEAPGYLGRDVVPTLEEIHLRVDPDTTRYEGRVRVTLAVARPTREVRLHADGPRLERVTLTQQGRAILVTPRPGERGLVTLVAERPLARGPAVLEIHFARDYSTQAVGLYRVQREGRSYLFTQFEAEDARHAFPCWDEPLFKIPWQVTLEVPERHAAVSNTPIARTTTRNGWKTVVFAKSPPLPSYLLAMAVGPLEFVDVPGMKVPTRIVTARGQARLAGVAVAAVPPVVAALERWFGEPYPYRKLDLIAAPDFWYGAMENAGAVVFADNALLVDPAAVSPAQRQRVTRIIAHELAHMWFGDLVTMAWWDDLWLNESFADWMADKIGDQVAPGMHVPLAELQDIQEIMETDARPSTEPIRHAAATGDDAMHTVGVSYNKGKAVLGMFESWIGEQAFRRGVRQYLRAHAWGNATHDDLWATFGAASGKDVAGAMAGFIEQNGVPLVTVEPLGDGRVRLSQSRFLNFGVSAEPRRWRIPIGMRWSDGRVEHRRTLLLAGADTTVVLEGGNHLAWLMPNAEGRGYYRWRVPDELLLALARHAGTLSPAERVALLGNLAALLDAGALHGDDYLRLLADLADEPQPLVASAMISGLERARTAFAPDALRDAFAAYVRGALAPMAARYGLERRDGEDMAVSLLRPKLLEWLGDAGRDRDAQALADRIAEGYMRDPTSVDAALVRTAIELHALRGDAALFERYRGAFAKTTAPVDRRYYLSALGSFEDPELQEEALAYVLQGPVRASETFVVPFAMAQHSDRGAERALRWAIDHDAEIRSRVPPEFMTRVAALAGGCDSTRFETARRFFAAADRAVQGTDKAFAKTGDQVEDCVGLRGREGARVAAYLRKVAGGGGPGSSGARP